MARKVKSRLALREEAEAAERAGATKKKPAAKKTPTRKARKKRDVSEVRFKLFWGVFNQSLKRVALYEFNEKKEADKKAKDLSKDGKTPHFVQKVKEQIQD